MIVIDETEADIRALIAQDFGRYEQHALGRDFIDWLQFKARTIPPVPREVITSPEVKLMFEEYPAIFEIQEALRAGISVLPWLSKTVCTKKTKASADMLFNDWQIIHFHLSSTTQNPTKVRRTGQLLFAHITGKVATLIDVEPHRAWTELTLLQKLQRTNSDAMYQANTITPEVLSSEQLKKMRKKHANALIDVGGKAVLPGGGIMCSGHSLRILSYYQWFMRQVEFLKKQFETDQVPRDLQHAIHALLGVPIRLGVWYSPHGLCIIDKNRMRLSLHQMRPLE